jgi:hypothetical protein
MLWLTCITVVVPTLLILFLPAIVGIRRRPLSPGSSSLKEVLPNQNQNKCFQIRRNAVKSESESEEVLPEDTG